MRVQVKLVVEVDARAWMDANGLPDARAKTVSDGVRSHLLNMAQQSPLIADECDGTVTLAR